MKFFKVTDESRRVHHINPDNIQMLSDSASNTKIQLIGSAITVKGGVDEVAKQLEDFTTPTAKKGKKASE